MHPTRFLPVLCLMICVLWLQPTVANLRPNTNPAVKEFGVADAALVLCFDKTIYAYSRSPAAESHTTDKNINYIKVETLNPKYGGVNAEITAGAIKTPNVVVTINEVGQKLLFKSNIRIMMFCEA